MKYTQNPHFPWVTVQAYLLEARAFIFDCTVPGKFESQFPYSGPYLCSLKFLFAGFAQSP